MNSTSTTNPTRRSTTQRWLNGIERAGNRSPDPMTQFVPFGADVLLPAMGESAG